MPLIATKIEKQIVDQVEAALDPIRRTQTYTINKVKPDGTLGEPETKTYNTYVANADVIDLIVREISKAVAKYVVEAIQNDMMCVGDYPGGLSTPSGGPVLPGTLIIKPGGFL